MATHYLLLHKSPNGDFAAHIFTSERNILVSRLDGDYQVSSQLGENQWFGNNKAATTVHLKKIGVDNRTIIKILED